MRTTWLPASCCHHVKAQQYRKLKSDPYLFFCRLMINGSMDQGTQLPYIREAQRCGYGVVVLNTNDNKPDVEVCNTIVNHYWSL